MQAVGMTGRDGQDAAVQLLGFRQPAGLMILGGGRENLLDLGRRTSRPRIFLRAALLAIHDAS
jgi:hypothetical protein